MELPNEAYGPGPAGGFPSHASQCAYCGAHSSAGMLRLEAESEAAEPGHEGPAGRGGTRGYARRFLLIAMVFAIPFSGWTLRTAENDTAVMRVPLDRVPEERVVSFGHSDTHFGVYPGGDYDAESPVQESATPRPAENAAADQAQPRLAQATPTRQSARPDRNGVLPIGYSLPRGISSEKGGVGVSKTIAVEEGTATGLTIFLIGGSLIEIDRGELVAALGQLGASDKAGRLPAANDTGRLSLESVRMAGLDVRYDAIRDRLILRP